MYTLVAEELRQVTPEELMRWLNIRTFGVADAGRDMVIKPMGRASTLAFWKKAVSFYMPDCLHGWCSGSNEGDPTTCAEVNNFIKYIEKLEARKQGADSQRRCLMTKISSKDCMEYSSPVVVLTVFQFGSSGCWHSSIFSSM
jgi:hypothetical protein